MAIREIYIRNRQDKSYLYNVVDFDNTTESIITQVRVLLGTSRGEVLGSYGFGCGVEDLIFTTRFNSEHLERKINHQISEHISPAFPNNNISAKVSFGHLDDQSDYAIIDVYIDNVKTIGFEVV